jgi:hypothetical protein
MGVLFWASEGLKKFGRLNVEWYDMFLDAFQGFSFYNFMYVLYNIWASKSTFSNFF